MAGLAYRSYRTGPVPGPPRAEEPLPDSSRGVAPGWAGVTAGLRAVPCPIALLPLPELSRGVEPLRGGVTAGLLRVDGGTW